MSEHFSLTHFKPDAKEAAERWAAYWQQEITDRPVLRATYNKPGFDFRPESTYHDRIFGDMDKILEDALYNAGGQVYLGEQMPSFWISFGTHEMADYMGAEIVWSDEASNTCWAKPFVEDWASQPPLRIDPENKHWKRMLKFYERAAEVFQGSIIPFTLDMHTNMDLLLSVRGDAELCYDTVDCPELIDRFMDDAREVFRYVWEETQKAGQMKRFGYWFDAYSPEPTTSLACDFSALVGPEMFKRWIMPTLEYEASFVDHVKFHWDGPAALRHFDDLMSIKKIHTISYVPNITVSHIEYLEMYQKIQALGKSVEFTGTPEEILLANRVLDPAKTLYTVKGQITPEAFEELSNQLKVR